MPVYEYECKECDRVFEVQQKMADAPLSHCPKCQAPIKKLMSMSSFQLRGGGWYADGYSSASSAAKSDVATAKSDTAAKPATGCPAGGSCAGCPATASA
jgi:putative FmdB family regulatory protein